MEHYKEKSKELLTQADPIIEKVVGFGLKHCRIDFKVTSTARCYHEQLELYQKGISDFDPRKLDHLARAQHVTGIHRQKSAAVDIALCNSHEGSYESCNRDSLLHIGSYLMGIADVYKHTKKHSFALRYKHELAANPLYLGFMNSRALSHLELDTEVKEQ